jgi:hypothetical protein
MTDDQIVFKYQRADDEQNTGRAMIFKRNPLAHWFNDYAEAQEFLPSSNAASEFVAIQPMVSRC